MAAPLNMCWRQVGVQEGVYDAQEAVVHEMEEVVGEGHVEHDCRLMDPLRAPAQA